MNMITPRTATASSPAVCEKALLIAEASPAWRPGTERISAVVSGATMIASPSPSSSDDGSTSLM